MKGDWEPARKACCSSPRSISSKALVAESDGSLRMRSTALLSTGSSASAVSPFFSRCSVSPEERLPLRSLLDGLKLNRGCARGHFYFHGKAAVARCRVAAERFRDIEPF